MEHKDRRRVLPSQKCPKCGKYAVLVNGACTACQPEAWWQAASASNLNHIDTKEARHGS